MKNSKRILFVLALALILVMSIVFVACDNNRQQTSDTLIVGTKMTIESLNRLHALGGEPGYNFSMISATVSQVTPIAKMDGNFVPVACNFTKSQDGSKVTLTLKDGFKWHDGKISPSKISNTLLWKVIPSSTRERTMTALKR